jgi:hypothetical protein
MNFSMISAVHSPAISPFPAASKVDDGDAYPAGAFALAVLVTVASGGLSLAPM